MLIDTHCHINMMTKEKFDTLMTHHELTAAKKIIETAAQSDVSYIINVGTSLVESKNSIELAQMYHNVYATVGIHPNDCTADWKKDFIQIKKMINHDKVVGVGECGVDMHYKGYHLQRQYDAFKAHIELALEYNKALVVHSRDSYDETLKVLDEYRNDLARVTIHCFSYDLMFARQVIEWGFKIGIDGPITYPKNDTLRNVVANVKLEDIVLETDAPFLPIQQMRGKQNAPQYLKNIAEYIAELRNEEYEKIAQVTTHNAQELFNF